MCITFTDKLTKSDAHIAIMSGKHGMISRRICPALFAAPRNRCGQDIVFFGEEIMFTSVAEDLLRCADLFVAVGTSGEIPPASRFVWEAWKNGAKTLAFNLEPPANSVCFDRLVLGKADETLPEFIKNQFMTV